MKIECRIVYMNNDATNIASKEEPTKKYSIGLPLCHCYIYIYIYIYIYKTLLQVVIKIK